MTVFEALFLATIQGLTEFLPISSTGHLVLFQKLFRFSQPPVFFDVLLHLGSLGAIIFFFRKEIWELLVNWRKKVKIWLILVVGSLPAAFFGFLLNAKIESTFNSLILVGITWLFFGLLLLSTSRLKNIKPEIKSLGEINWRDSLVVGIFQAAALLPGISRSGSTIIGGLWRKSSREIAFEFSFLLSIPAIFGAVLLEGSNAHLSGVKPFWAVIALAVAGVVGYFALRLLQKILKSEKFYLFGFYCLAIGLFSLLLSLKF